jgi:hypothetical protein
MGVPRIPSRYSRGSHNVRQLRFRTNDGEVWNVKDTDAVVVLGPFPRLRGEYTFCPVNDDGSIPDAIAYHHHPYYE